MDELCYQDENGRKLFISAGLGGNTFGTFYQRSKSGGMHRYKSPSLPMRDDLQQASDDLKAYADLKGWKRV